MKILCLGSLNLDHVYQVNHIVRPGETVSCRRKSIFCGGKGLNQSIALSRAGANVYHAGKIGADGDALLQQLQQAGVNTDILLVDPQTSTGHAIIQVSESGQNSIVIDGGANLELTEKEIDDILSCFGAGDILLMQNETNNLEYAIRKASEKKMTIALNPSPIDERLIASPALSLVDWFVLNEIEGFELTGMKDGREICIAMKAKYPKSVIMLTLGKQGCLYYDGTNYYSHGVYDVPVVDTTAAGDTFTGYFLACMQEGMPIEQVLTLASKASSLAIGQEGASNSIPARESVENADIRLVSR